MSQHTSLIAGIRKRVIAGKDCIEKKYRVE